MSDASAVVGSAPNRPAQFSAATASREVEENTPAGQDIGTAISATDLDNDPLTYAIRNDSELFAIVASTGQLRTKGSLDYETRTSHTIVVEVTDNKDIDGVADMVIDDEIQVTITIEDVNEPAIISGPQTVDWLENTAGTIATYTASDPDLGGPGLPHSYRRTGLGLLRLLERPAQLQERGTPRLRAPELPPNRTGRRRR